MLLFKDEQQSRLQSHTFRLQTVPLLERTKPFTLTNGCFISWIVHGVDSGYNPQQTYSYKQLHWFEWVHPTANGMRSTYTCICLHVHTFTQGVLHCLAQLDQRFTCYKATKCLRDIQRQVVIGTACSCLFPGPGWQSDATWSFSPATPLETLWKERKKYISI